MLFANWTTSKLPNIIDKISHLLVLSPATHLPVNLSYSPDSTH